MQQDRDHLHQHHERGAAGNDQEEITSQPKSNPRSKNPSLPSQAENNQEHHEAQNCPRCDSANTKFCYYNNYSLTQPRYFCKTCRRYWTQGGTLRNVPVGGGCRKATKRAKTASTSATSSLPNILNNNSSSGSMLTQPASLPPLSPLLLPPSPPLSQNMIMGSSSNSIQFSSGGYAISSLPTINDHNHPHPHHQSLIPQFQPPSMIDLSANYTGQSARLGSNLGLYEPAGFNIHPFGLSSHQVPFYPSHHDQGSLMTQSNSRSTNTTRARNSSSQHHYDEWYHDDQIGFIDNINNQTAAADASLWTIGNNSTTAAGSSSGGGPTTKWHDNHHLPGFHGGPDHQAP